LASLGNFGGLANAVGGIKNPADQYIAYMKSVTLQNELIDKFKLVERYKTNSKTDARVALSGNVRINSGKDGLISVEVDDIDPKFAADLANSYVDELGKLLGRLAVTEAQKRRFFFEKQLILAKEKLIQSEIALKSTGISGTVLKSSPALAITTVASLQAAITSQEVKLGAMHGYFSDTSPDFIQAMRELKNLKSQLERQEKLIPVKMDSKIEDSDYISRYREFKYNETLYELFSKQFEVAKLDEAREGVIVQVLDYAIPPEKKSKPKRAIIAISTTIAVGFLLLIFILITKIIENTKKDANSEKKIVALKSSLLKAFGRI
jgi:capsule polysaccharide export protein KpsE/RkpR